MITRNTTTVSMEFYRLIHRIMRVLYPNRDFCALCKKVPPDHIANITGVYNIDWRNWRRLCRKCHYALDKTRREILRKKLRKCSECGTRNVRGSDGYDKWYGHLNGWHCINCYRRINGYTKRIKPLFSNSEG